ncbi:hypothetical protein [Myxosarcina sp. GI1]|uniref:hypothetical protein n=1 Tax=Myxosarcina sp. GI1 TaxID=1541065 RepID=UPI0005633DFD|nr:hypothetical protein [Myxosarcina sp. GI1]
MSTIFTHKSGYLISVKLLANKKTIRSSKPKLEQHFLGDREAVENILCLEERSRTIDTSSLTNENKFLIDAKDYSDYPLEKPSFNRLEIAINNFLLASFTIVAAIIAAFFIPSFLVSTIKRCYGNTKISSLWRTKFKY